MVALQVACAGRSQTHTDDDAGGGVSGEVVTGRGGTSGAVTSSGGASNKGGQSSAGTAGVGAVGGEAGEAGASGAIAQGATAGVAGSAGVPGTAGENGAFGGAGNSGEGGASSGSAGEGGTPGCEDGCGCEGWWADCDGVPGCETPLDGPLTCGACNIPAIAYEHARMVCSNPYGTYPICEPGFGDCQPDRFDCETSYEDAQPSCLPIYLGSLELDPSLSVRMVRLGAGGEIYLAGGFGGTVDFDPGPASDLVSASSNSSAFVTKLGADGSYVWTRTYGGTDGMPAWGNDVAVVPDGSVLFLGSSVGAVDLEPALQSNASDPSKTAFVVNLSQGGEQRWSRSLDAPEGLSGSRISIGETGEIYVLMGLNPDGPGYQRARLTKLDSAGQPLWSRSGQSGRSVYPSGVVATADGVAVTLGLAESCLLEGFPEELTSANPTHTVGLLARFDTNGTGVESGFFEGQDPISFADVHRLERAGDGGLFVAGSLSGKADLDPGADTAPRGVAADGVSSFVTRLAEDGSFVWAQAIPSFGLEDMAVAEDGSVFLTGYPAGASHAEILAFAPTLRSRFALSFDGVVQNLAAGAQQLVVIGSAVGGTDIDPTTGVDISTTDRTFIARFALSVE